MRRLEAPTVRARVDTGVRSGSVVPAEYDSLLAKLIVWGEDRAQAVVRSRAALRAALLWAAHRGAFHRAARTSPRRPPPISWASTPPGSRTSSRRTSRPPPTSIPKRPSAPRSRSRWTGAQCGWAARAPCPGPGPRRRRGSG
ncbi:hypothetical protein QJS66_12190 [Kocuria rhizophila]|nr:hypothetical protein QJS66_12190 [Kocuria rhizophila]